MTTTESSSAPSTPRQVLAKVPEISIVFWALKLLTTGMGEAMSDALGQKSVPLAAAIGIFGMALALWLQIRQREYRAPYYWFAVMMVAVFGTMVADGIHDGAGIGYAVTTPVFAALTALVFWRWHHSEGTLSIHTITTRRRERYYWAAVLCTFALGTAAGDLTAYALNLGFWPSALLFAVLFAIPAVGWFRFGWNPIFAFWFAYVVTRPLGASLADGFSKPHAGGGGLNIGDPTVALVELAIFIAMVAWVTVKRIDVQPPHELVPHPHPHAEPHAHLPHPHHPHPHDPAHGHPQPADSPRRLGVETD